MNTSASGGKSFPGGLSAQSEFSGRVRRCSFDGQPAAVKSYDEPRLSGRRLLHAVAALWRGSLPVEDLSAQRRCVFEKATLAVWRKHGFRAPSVLGDAIDAEGRPCLYLEWIDGPTLAERLASSDVPYAEKLCLLGRILADSAGRHLVAVTAREPKLVHFDSNTRNVILASGGPVHIDFEMGSLHNPVALSASEEAGKFLRWAARDVGPGAIDDLAGIAVAAYERLPEVLADIPGRVLGRKGQFWHRRRDLARHRRNPADVTIADVAKAVSRALR